MELRLRRRLRPWTAFAFVLSQMFAGLVACDRAPCAGRHPASKHPKAPRIVSVQAVQQDVLDPWSLVVELVFTAPHGDASDGNLDMYIGAGGPVTIPLEPYFGPSGVAPDAQSGRLAIPIHLSSNAVQDDSLLRLGLQLVDGSHAYSNCTTLELHMLVDAVGFAPRQRRARTALACRGEAHGR